MENGREMKTSRNVGFPKENTVFFLVPKHKVLGGNNPPLTNTHAHSLCRSSKSESPELMKRKVKEKHEETVQLSVSVCLNYDLSKNL